ncbi:hypothetical protein Cgig2_011946 [Carnegiea gigantea]|uniref:Uncharacterized protein n=1 Tax=Carnegiea gigantea TaxID=171969 RepID=A0A9Q1GP89_9CARY|nr:hypothetical protein Cgig2_011946 [Carnegiea gigantea]
MQPKLGCEPTRIHATKPIIPLAYSTAASTAYSSTGGRTMPATEHVMATRDKILIEPEGDTYILYFLSLFIKSSKNTTIWLPQYDRLNLFAYARKSAKAPDFFIPRQLWTPQKYREGPDIQKLSAQHKKNRNNDPEDVGSSLHTCGATPIAEWHRRIAQHTKRWQEYRTSQPPPMTVRKALHLLSTTFEFKEISLARVACMALRQPCLSVSTRSSSVNNYDARAMATRLYESVSKAVKHARQEEFHK